MRFKNPCKECIVNVMCSKQCSEYKDYENTKETLELHFVQMLPCYTGLILMLGMVIIQIIKIIKKFL
jgi:hypothetical protein